MGEAAPTWSIPEPRRINEQAAQSRVLAAELDLDATVEGSDLPEDLIRRPRYAEGKDRSLRERRHGVPPV